MGVVTREVITVLRLGGRKRRVNPEQANVVSGEDGQDMPTVKIREMLRILAADGWSQTAQRGSHRQFEHPTKPGRVTVAGKDSDDLAKGTLNSILKQAGLRKH